MEEFKEELINLYRFFVYEGNEIYDFWRKNEFSTRCSDEEAKNRIEILKKHCLEDIFYEFIKTSYILDKISNYHNNYLHINSSSFDDNYIYDKFINIKKDYVKQNDDIKNINTYITVKYKNNVLYFQFLLKIFDIDYTKIII